MFLGFPAGSAGKESTCNVGDLGLIPGLGSSPGEGIGCSLQCSCLENPHGQRSLGGCSPWGHKESDTLTSQAQHSKLRAVPLPTHTFLLYPPSSEFPPITQICLATEASLFLSIFFGKRRTGGSGGGGGLEKHKKICAAGEALVRRHRSRA